jgi:hypothetical protein
MTNAESIVEQVQESCRRCNDAFNHEDASTYLDCWHIPNVFIAEMGVMPHASRAEFAQAYSRVMVEFKERGWRRTDIDRCQVWPLAPNLALLFADKTRYKTDNSVLERVRYAYTLRNDGSSWKILSVVEVQAPFTGPWGPRI